ncbi:MAG: ATP-grasp domain-containing protein [Clostridia bacterium]|nr:ATP-grasp domain-containing protein [Clostridia bacterium]
MKNFIFISPNFPENYWKFCRELKNDGLRVLGIGDCPYDMLSHRLKASLDEYYKVSSLENYDEVYRAVAFFAFKYGRIDFLESNNEYWLERDARLRTDFNITSGYLLRQMKAIKYKSEMKKYYKKAGLTVARHCLVKSLKGCKNFIAKVGYPVIVKPDNGVGANATYKLKNDGELAEFIKSKPQGYIMEEYIDGLVNSYDAIVDGNGNPVFETGLVEMGSLMDTVNENGNSLYYYDGQLAEDIRAAGRKALKAFGVKSRFIHFEFFRLSCDQFVGRKGEVVALEVNMRPAGGISPDMMNYANSTDVYKIWADMIAFDSTLVPVGKKYYCAYAGRRDGKSFAYSEQSVIDRFGKNMLLVERIPKALSGAMADLCFLANFDTKEEMFEFFDFAIKE